MKCKKSLMGLAALLIIVFHFWMQLTVSPLETNIVKSTYLGVDIFFLVSAYSLSHMRQSSYLDFIGNRLVSVYLPFAILAIICAIYKKWAISRLALVLCGAEFFIKGGGSFLWFAPAIMIIYLFAPLFVKLKKNLGWKFIVLSISTWLILVCLLQFVCGYTTVFILLNRLPIIIIGLYYDELRNLVWKHKPLAWILPLLGIGAVLVYKFCGSMRLSKPIAESYYLCLIPFTVALVLLCDLLSEKDTKDGGPLAFIGGFTLELYGLQMIFGYDLETAIYRSMKSKGTLLQVRKLSAFVVTALLLILMAWVYSLPERALVQRIRNAMTKEKRGDRI